LDAAILIYTRAVKTVALVITLAIAPGLARAGDFDFELTPSRRETPEAQRERGRRADELARKVKKRRLLLRLHQGFGFAALGVLAATLIVGQLNYHDRFDRDGEYTSAYMAPHLGLAVGSAVLFTTTGLLALVAPEPYEKPLKLDAALAHKVFMAAATVTMALELILGPISASREGHLDQRDFAAAHLAIGYATFAFMGAGVLSYVF
jgi:ABC-type uncharacterized transport system YnjBCD permease subunit